MTQHGCYQKATELCNKNSMFYKQYIDSDKADGQSQLCHWLSRLLNKIGLTGRKEIISQKIRNNWVELSKEFSKATRDSFLKAAVDVIVCADQTFVTFLLVQEDLLVPRGIKRVGTTIETNDRRKGVTLTLTALVSRSGRTVTLHSGLLPPFMVFNRVTGKTLDKRHSDWSRRPGHSGGMNFQCKHWFDKHITLR